MHPRCLIAVGTATAALLILLQASTSPALGAGRGPAAASSRTCGKPAVAAPAETGIHSGGGRGDIARRVTLPP